MHLENKNIFKTSGRRLAIPAWALDDRELQKVCVRYIEGMVRHSIGPGTLKERLNAAIVRRLAHKPLLAAVLEKLSRQYVAAKNAGADSAQLKQFGKQIKNVDTQLRYLGREHAMAASVVYRYYRLGENSVDIEAALGIHPPHIRLILLRLHKIARKLATMVHISMRINLLRGLNHNPVAVPAKGQRQCWVCGCFFTPKTGQHRLCSPECRKIGEAQKRKAKGKRMPKKYYCGPACKEVSRFAVQGLPVLAKAGVGTWVPQAAKPGYASYVQFCTVIGVTPLPETAWRMETAQPRK